MRIRPPSYLPILLGFPLAVLAAVLGHYALVMPDLYDRLLAAHPALRIPFLMAGLQGSVLMFARACGGAAVVFLATAFCVMFVLRGWVLWLYRKCCLSTYVVGLLCIMLINRATTLLLDSNISLDGSGVNPVTVFFTRWHLLWPVWTGLLLTGVLHLLSLRRKVIGLYTGIHDERPATGDRVVENILSNGRDPLFRKSLLGSLGLHVLVILVIPCLLTMRGCVEPYRVPKGSGTPATLASVVKITKVVKKKAKKRKFVVNPRSAISFHIPDLDESVAARQVEADTQLTYKADPMRGLTGTGKAGKMGAGGGTQGGWPDGMDNAKVRFIRMEYSGRGWDDGMDMTTRADLNFLSAFNKLTGFKVSTTPESHPISLLRKYPKGGAPPFVYMTGDAGINVTAGEIAAMREYLLDGGMLFADCGSPQWNNSFRQFVRQLLPGESLVTISDDDPLFQIPYAFPNGAPPLWHHGGTRAMGIKHKGRWVVFYHPGDINDAWKTGHSGMDSAMAEGAIHMGVNIIYYAFTHYLEMTRKYRQ
jgi:hypothetical protein